MDAMNGVHARAVRKAVELAGDASALARRLGVPAAEVGAWLEGNRQPPQDVFLRVVDILLEKAP